MLIVRLDSSRLRGKSKIILELKDTIICEIIEIELRLCQNAIKSFNIYGLTWGGHLLDIDFRM